MKKIFILTKTQERHRALSEFLKSKGYTNDQVWIEYSFFDDFFRKESIRKELIRYVRGEENELPAFCIFDPEIIGQKKKIREGQVIFERMQKKGVIDLFMPVIYLVGQRPRFASDLDYISRCIFWEQDTPLTEEVQNALSSTMEELLCPREVSGTR